MAETAGLTGKELFEAIKKDYVNTYAYRICNFLSQLDPDTFKREFGSIENCVKEVVDDAEVWFNKWLPNYVSGVIARVKPATK
ncbi:MAG: hypothetical protein JHC33_04845 [Ignisphaera sp.]|nr:hypothetical protein [Ignisphaera sp.]